MFLELLLAAAAAATAVFAQSSTLPPVPHGTPIPGNYTGPYRPQVHYSPPQGFMNDPNGCFRDANGTWHLYYQLNPTGIVAGNQHWGHATSQDLYHWINQPIALFPANESSYIFSGSIVVDTNNTSGFFPNQDNGVVAIYTIATYEPVALESQGLAYSHDGGYTFDFYAGNPVLDIGSDQFRDPKVFRYNDHWVMVVAYAQDFVVGFFTSPDLKTWTHASNFSHHGLLGLQYECPNLVQVPVEGTNDLIWMLQISINPGAPLGGSTSQYFLGAFDGFAFTPSDNSTRLNEFAKDAYAGQFFANLPPGEAVSIAWASNWEYTQVVPTGETEGWRSAMAAPRRITARHVERLGLIAAAVPYDMTPVTGDRLADEDLSRNSSTAIDFAHVPSNAIMLNISLTNLPPRANLTSGTVNFTLLSPVTGESLKAGYMLAGDNPIYIDRSGVRALPENPFFTDKFSATALAPRTGGAWSLTALFDRSMLELFVDGGALSSTSVAYAASPLTLLSVGAAGLPTGVRARVTVDALASGWAAAEDAGGTVRGNVSTKGGSSSTGGAHRRMLYEALF